MIAIILYAISVVAGPVAGDTSRDRHVTAFLHVTPTMPADLADSGAGISALVAVHTHAVRPDISRRHLEGHADLVSPHTHSLASLRTHSIHLVLLFCRHSLRVYTVTVPSPATTAVLHTRR